MRICSCPPAEVPRTSMGWPIQPEAFRDTLITVSRRYGLPIYVLENGTATPDRLENGEVQDPSRIDYLRSYIAAMQEAIAAGVDVRGYFVWSLLDNFEWNSGYKERFGLVHVDYGTQRRTLKASAYWYADMISKDRRAAAAARARGNQEVLNNISVRTSANLPRLTIRAEVPMGRSDAEGANTVSSLSGEENVVGRRPLAANMPRHYLLWRFWSSAFGFWRRGGSHSAWPLLIALMVLILSNLALDLVFNRWNKWFFDALEQKSAAEVLRQALIFVPLAAGSVMMGVANVYLRMTVQRLWRTWMNTHILDYWLAHDRYYQLNLVRGEHQNRNIESRKICESAPKPRSILPSVC